MAAQEELDRYLAKWRKRLRLMDWEIEVHWDDGTEMPANSLGYMEGLPEKRMAWIWIGTEEYVQSLKSAPYDPERTLVHELLHVHLSAITRGGGWKIFEEQAVHAISCALVEASRGSL